MFTTESEPIRSRKPVIIGLAGGIGSGKSEVASCFENCGALKIDSDSLVKQVYADSQVRLKVTSLLGDQAYLPEGEPDRPWIADRVFSDPEIRSLLNKIIHPCVARLRESMIKEAVHDGQVRLIVLDSPLLYETGLNNECDAVVFVNTPEDVRQMRIHQTRGWSIDELCRRDRSQIPVTEKRGKADYIVQNSGSRSDLQKTIQELYKRILLNADKDTNCCD